MDSFVFIFQSSWPQSKLQSHPKSLAAPRWPSMPAVFAPTRPARQSTLRAPILGRCPGRASVAAGHRKWDLQPISSLTAVDAPMRSHVHRPRWRSPRRGRSTTRFSGSTKKTAAVRRSSRWRGAQIALTRWPGRPFNAKRAGWLAGRPAEGHAPADHEPISLVFI